MFTPRSAQSAKATLFTASRKWQLAMHNVTAVVILVICKVSVYGQPNFEFRTNGIEDMRAQSWDGRPGCTQPMAYALSASLAISARHELKQYTNLSSIRSRTSSPAISLVHMPFVGRQCRATAIRCVAVPGLHAVIRH